MGCRGVRDAVWVPFHEWPQEGWAWGPKSAQLVDWGRVVPLSQGKGGEEKRDWGRARGSR